MLLRPFNTLIALFTAVIIFLGVSILYNAREPPQSVVPFAVPNAAPGIAQNVQESVLAQPAAAANHFAGAEEKLAEPVANAAAGAAVTVPVSGVTASAPVYAAGQQAADAAVQAPEENGAAAPAEAAPVAPVADAAPEAPAAPIAAGAAAVAPAVAVANQNSPDAAPAETAVDAGDSDVEPSEAVPADGSPVEAAVVAEAPTPEEAAESAKEDAVLKQAAKQAAAATEGAPKSDAAETVATSKEESEKETVAEAAGKKLAEETKEAEAEAEAAAEVALEEVEKSNSPAPDADPAKTEAEQKAEADARKQAQEKKKADALAAYVAAAERAKKEKAALAAYAAAVEKAKKEKAAAKAAENTAAEAKAVEEKPAEPKFLPAIKKGNLPNPLRIFLTENGGSHEEVFAALIYAFAQLPNSYIYEYLFRPRFNIFAVLKTFGLTNLAKPRGSTSMKFDAMNPIPDVILGTTCEFDIRRLKNQFTTMRDAGSYLFCTVHHGDRWHKDSFYHFYTDIIPWIESKQITFIFLSGHTKRFMEDKVIPSWAPEHQFIKDNFRVFVPVFPVPVHTKKELSFSLQGNYESERRDYKSIFTQFESFGKKNPENERLQQLRMHLIGHGKHPEVPASIKSRVEFNEGLEFAEFYKILSDSFALLPAFANDEYYDRKASSSVPASLIAGVPIVGKKRLLKTYDYLTEDSIWLQNDNEADLDVIERILELPEGKIEEQKARTRQRNKEIVQENIGKALTWCKEISYTVKRTGDEVVKAGWTWEW